MGRLDISWVRRGPGSDGRIPGSWDMCPDAVWMSLATLPPGGTARFTEASGISFLDGFKHLKDGYPKAIGDDLHRIQCRVRLPSLNATQVRLVETASFAKFHLAKAPHVTHVTHVFAELLGQGLHPSDSQRYALIHINTNSYIP